MAKPRGTSTAANVGADKDSDTRQRQAVAGFAKRAGFDLVGEFYDAAVSGSPIEGRPCFKALLERVLGKGVRVVIVKEASRFARHLLSRHLVAGRPGRVHDVFQQVTRTNPEDRSG